MIKTIFLPAFILSFSFTLNAQSNLTMEQFFIKTKVGDISVYRKSSSANTTPIIFLHGVYFDHHLWDNQIAQINDRTVIAIDMPLHGASKINIKDDWRLKDCADMLLEILDSLSINKVIAVGHSWGSMTIVRAANKNPNRFAALGLCNMPFKGPTVKEKRAIRFQHSAMVFRKFYMNQAGKSLMGKQSIRQQPQLLQQLIMPMSKLTNRDIKYTDRAVRINAEDATAIVHNLTVPAMAIVGEEDYVGIPPIEKVQTVKGGHVSPLEAPEMVNDLITKLVALANWQ
jgi:pimeloyl-ACP methyl ester carboxylesterase